VSLTYPGNAAFSANGDPLLVMQLSNQNAATFGSDVAGVARGDNNASDWYFITGITLSYNFLDNGLIGGRKRSKGSKMGCPTF